jgi:hypothetical protein
MKKLFSLTAVLALITTSVIYTGCKKTDTTDTTAPVITLNGLPTCFLQKGWLYNDPSATAIDDKDGTVSVTSSNPINPSILGTYTITYTAKDQSGNTATKSRTVYVVDVQGGYSVMKITPYPAIAAGDTTTYSDYLFLSGDLTGQLNFSSFSNYVNGLAYSQLNNTATLTIPGETINCGSPAIDRNFNGSGTISNTLAPHTKITINFTEVSDTTLHSRLIYSKI